MAEMNKAISLFVIGAISLLMAAVFITQIADAGNDVTEKSIYTDESIGISTARQTGNTTINLNTSNFTVTYAPTGWKVSESDCALSDVSIRNSTAAGYTTLTKDTDYKIWDTIGRIQFFNTANLQGSGNTTYITYTTCPDSYVTQSWGRTAIDTTMGLYAIAAMLIAVGMFYGAYRMWGKQ